MSSNISLGRGVDGKVNLAKPVLTRQHVAAALHNIQHVNRFLGATGAAWSVARHQLAGCLYLEEQHSSVAGVYFSVHDLHEAIVGDITRPMKTQLIKATGNLRVVSATEKVVDDQLYAALRIGVPTEPAVRIVKQTDELMLLAEMDVFLGCRLDEPRFEHNDLHVMNARNIVYEVLTMSDTKVLFQLAIRMGIVKELVELLTGRRRW